LLFDKPSPRRVRSNCSTVPGGLFLLVQPTGSRYWRFKYRINGKEKMLALGVYPVVPLKLARERRADARRLVSGADPSAKRQAEKISRSDTFEAIAREWLALQEHQLSTSTLDKVKGTFETLIFMRLGDRPITTIKASDLLATLRKIEERGTYETTHRAKHRSGRSFVMQSRHAARSTTCRPIGAALAPVVSTNRAALTDPVRVGELLRAIDGYRGASTTAYSLVPASSALPPVVALHILLATKQSGDRIIVAAFVRAVGIAYNLRMVRESLLIEWRKSRVHCC
jgi:hypothetical protein